MASGKEQKANILREVSFFPIPYLNSVNQWLPQIFLSKKCRWSQPFDGESDAAKEDFLNEDSHKSQLRSADHDQSRNSFRDH